MFKLDANEADRNWCEIARSLQPVGNPLQYVPDEEVAESKGVVYLDKKFDESQPRNADGEWSSVGGAAGARPTAKQRVVKEELHRRESKLRKNAKELGLVAEFAAAEKNMRDVLANSHVQINRKSLESVEDLLVGSGRMKTQFETGQSNGTYDPDLRIRGEAALFGERGWSLGDRPVYGTVQSDNADAIYHNEFDRISEAYLTSYGSIQIHLKSSANDRATFTSGDSLMFDREPISGRSISYVQPSPMTSPSMASLFSRSFIERTGDEFGDEFRFDETRANELRSSLERIAKAKTAQQLTPETYNTYVEAQVHGQVRNTDIERIVIGSYYHDRLSAAAKRKIAELNIEVEISQYGLTSRG